MISRASARLLRLSVRRYRQQKFKKIKKSVPTLSQPVQSTLPRPNITMCSRVLSHLFLSVCVCATDNWSRSSFQVTTFTFLSADVGKTIDLVAYWRLAFTDCNQTHFCCQFWLHSLYSWVVLMVFSAVSMDSSYEVVELVRVGKRNRTKQTTTTTVWFVMPYWRSLI